MKRDVSDELVQKTPYKIQVAEAFVEPVSERGRDLKSIFSKMGVKDGGEKTHAFVVFICDGGFCNCFCYSMTLPQVVCCFQRLCFVLA